MARICKKCGKKISMFMTPEIDEQGDIVCKECSDKIKAEKDQAQKQKEEIEYRTKLAKALSNNPQCEYKVANLKIEGIEEELNRLGLEGWNLVSSFVLNNPAPPQEEKKPEQQTPQPAPQPQPPISGIVCIFKRKL